MTQTTDDKLAQIRAELDRAEAQIAATLSQEPRAFSSPADLRSQFNEARSRKLSASQRMSILKEREG